VTQSVRQLRLTFLLTLSLFSAGLLAITGYTLWRLNADAVRAGYEISALHTRSFEDYLTQSLHIAELAAATSVTENDGRPDLAATEVAFLATLRNSPFLRSVSLVDDQNRIIASSNPANIGQTITLEDFLPPVSGAREILRIGVPWAGRDFAGGRRSTEDAPLDADALSFIPVARSLSFGDHAVTILIALNPDFFVNQMSQNVHSETSLIKVLRYDGTLLIANDTDARAGTVNSGDLAALVQTDAEHGRFERDTDDNGGALSTFRASSLYPFIVITHLYRDTALQGWRSEAKALVFVVGPALLAVILIAGAFYRRRIQLMTQRAEAERLQRINATVFESSAEAIVITDVNADIISVNAAFTRITGYGTDEVIGRNPRLLASGTHDRAFYTRMWTTLLNEGFWRGQLVNRRKDGTLYHVLMSITASRDTQGRLQHYIGDIVDITERKQAEERLHLAASVFTHAHEAIMITAPDGRIIDVNAAFSRMTGFSREEALGQNPRILKSGRQSDEFYATMWKTLVENGQWSGEVWNRRKNGEVFAEMQTISAVHDEHGNIQRYVALFSDISRLKEHESQLEHIAHYDALTSLPNRVLLADRLHQAMAQAQRRKQRLAVAYLDLDGFKAVNDHHGHDAGDQLLMTVSTRMRQTLREGDTLARLGGDEFVAVLVDLDAVADSVTLLSRLLAAAAQPVHVDDLVLQVSASVGVTFYPQTEEVDADQLLRQADQSMYQAKLSGKNCYHVFDADHDRSVRGHYESLERIRQAMTENELVMYYQPKVNMRTGMVVGAEALIRWQHPEKGLLLPGSFLPVIENHPLSIELGDWVIDTTLSQMEAWHALGLDLHASINVGARQLRDPGFVDRLRDILSVHPQILPSCVELEVLETSALEDLAGVAEIIQACSELGVKFALDDFGTGYSSLTYLKRLPVAQLKIDQSFVRDILDDPDDLAIVESVLGLAAAFRRQVIAEGVETVEHGELLLQLGCELAQGYGIARPMPAAAIPGWCASWRPDPTWQACRTVRRSALPLLFASVEHRAWISALIHYLKGERGAPPPLDRHECAFGKWLDAGGLNHRRGDRTWEQIQSLHRSVHELGTQLCTMHARDEDQHAELERGIRDLLELRDALILQLRALLQLAERPAGQRQAEYRPAEAVTQRSYAAGTEG